MLTERFSWGALLVICLAQLLGVVITPLLVQWALGTGPEWIRACGGSMIILPSLVIWTGQMLALLLSLRVLIDEV